MSNIELFALCVCAFLVVPAWGREGAAMTDEELVERASTLVPVYVDGFRAYRKVNGVLRCIGFTIETADIIPQLNLIISLVGADQSMIDAQNALHAVVGSAWAGAMRSH